MEPNGSADQRTAETVSDTPTPPRNWRRFANNAAEQLGNALVLAALMLIFAILGFALAPSAVIQIHGYDHGEGETERCGVVLIFGGALFGAFLYFLWSRKAASLGDLSPYEMRPISYFELCRWLIFVLIVSAIIGYVAYEAFRPFP